MKILLAVCSLILVSSRAWAGTEIKGTCGNSLKTLALTWAKADTSDPVKVDSKSAHDAINQFLDKSSDWTLVETSFLSEQAKKAEKRSFLYLPAALGAQAVVYNLPGVPAGKLKLTPKLLSDIYLGLIKNWNDPVIRKLNPDLYLPDLDLVAVHLSNASSLNDPFPAFLAQENPKWTLKREKDKNLHWFTGENVGDVGKALDKVRQWAGSIAVLPFSFAFAQAMPMARLENSAGAFVEPSAQSIAAAVPVEAASFEKPASLIQSEAPGAYPLSFIAWVVVDRNYEKDYHQPQKGQSLAGFLKGILSDEGQKKAADLTGAALPAAWTVEALQRIDSIQF
jgi:phosphate transport system substrate-binding protein